MEILRGMAMLNTKNFKGRYEAKLEFPEGCGGSNQKPSVGGVWIFSGTTQSSFVVYFNLLFFYTIIIII